MPDSSSASSGWPPSPSGIAANPGGLKKPLPATADRLQKELDARPLLWVGAGASVAAGYPGTGALLDALEKRADDPIDRKAPFPQVVDAFVESRGAGELGDLLQRLFQPRSPEDHQPTPVHRAIARLAGAGRFHAIATTNYDDLLERALAEAGVPYVLQPLEDNAPIAGDGAVRLLKLHGSLDDWMRVVLSGRSYQEFGHRYPFLSAQLDVLLRQRPVLFVGCSLQDPRLLDWLTARSEEQARGLKPWRALMTEKDWKEATEAVWEGGQASGALARGNIKALLLRDHGHLAELWGEVAGQAKASAEVVTIHTLAAKAGDWRFALPPPQNAQDFEDLCFDLWSRLWNDPDTQRSGRWGQFQKGVDIYGRNNRESEWTGVQCKLRNQQALSSHEINNAVNEAKGFKPPLSHLIIATTSPQNIQLKEAVGQLHKRAQQSGLSSATVLFWEDIAPELAKFPELLFKHYISKYYLAPIIIHQAETKDSSKIELIVRRKSELDYVSLVPAFSSADPQEESDLTYLSASLSNVEVINHDTNPTEIQSLLIILWDSRLQREIEPREIKEEALIGALRINARSRQRYELRYASIFDGSIQQSGDTQVFLKLKAIGLGEKQVSMENFWQPKHLTSQSTKNKITIKASPAQASAEPPSARRLKVFLCHSSTDKPAVRQLYKNLVEDGFLPWLDEEDILGGQVWDTEIRKAVRAADVVVICLSNGSITKAGYVQKEIRFALDIAEEQPEDSIYIVPVKLESCSVPERLSKWQWVSLFEEAGYERLLRTLRARASSLEN